MPQSFHLCPEPEVCCGMQGEKNPTLATFQDTQRIDALPSRLFLLVFTQTSIEAAQPRMITCLFQLLLKHQGLN